MMVNASGSFGRNVSSQKGGEPLWDYDVPSEPWRFLKCWVWSPPPRLTDEGLLLNYKVQFQRRAQQNVDSHIVETRSSPALQLNAKPAVLPIDVENTKAAELVVPTRSVTNETEEGDRLSTSRKSPLQLTWPMFSQTPVYSINYDRKKNRTVRRREPTKFDLRRQVLQKDDRHTVKTAGFPALQ